MVTIRLAHPDDAGPIAAAQARAFYDDPLQSWAIADAATRLATLETMFELLSRLVTIPRGTAYVSDDCAAAAFWVAPGRWNEPLSSDVRRQLRALENHLDVDAARRFAVANDAMHAVHPDAPHWYLQGLGTDPDQQRNGLGTAVLRPVLERADADGAACYLESTKWDNVSFYERNGFVVTATIDIGEGGPTLWAMWRDPR